MENRELITKAIELVQKVNADDSDHSMNVTIGEASVCLAVFYKGHCTECLHAFHGKDFKKTFERRIKKAADMTAG